MGGLVTTNGSCYSSIRALRSYTLGRVFPPRRGLERSSEPPRGFERPGPVWRLLWDGERRRLGLPPLPYEKDEEEGEKERDEEERRFDLWCEGIGR